MTTVAEQVQHESRLRPRYAGVAFCAAVLLVGSQLIQLSGAHSPVNEVTVTLITENQRATLDIVGAILEMFGLGAVAALLYWLHRSAQARRPEFRTAVRLTVTVGALAAAVMAVVYVVIFTQKAQQFVSSGDQSYPQASHMFSATLLVVVGLLLDLGEMLLAVGVILSSLSAMRVGLVTRMVGYAGVVSGALFLIVVPVLTPVIQGFWLAATAVILARRWPSGDPPAWDAGVAVPWQPLQSANQRDNRGTRAQRRARVSDKDVLAAVEKSDTPPNPRAGRSKRKRRR
jgi:hypothetical protein